MLRAHSSFPRSAIAARSLAKKGSLPFRMSQKACQSPVCLFCMAAVQIKEPWLSSSQRIKFFSATFGAYFFLHSRAHRSLGIFSHRHQILALRTLFMIPGSLRPRPPCSLGRQSLSQLTKAIFFPVLSPCQMKFR
jgi:hypothetical protein